MKIIGSFRSHDFDPSTPAIDYDSFNPRTAGRAVILDSDKVALIFIGKHGYYMLPGGGISDEDVLEGLRREIKEELGSDAEIICEVGIAESYIDRWKNKQTDYCYLAKIIPSNDSRDITDFELEEGHEVVWASNITEAIKLVEGSNPENMDGKIIRARDLAFLKEAGRILQHDA